MNAATETTYLTTASVGPAFFIFRSPAPTGNVDVDLKNTVKLPGVFKSKIAANKQARAIAATTGETLR